MQESDRAAISAGLALRLKLVPRRSRSGNVKTQRLVRVSKLGGTDNNSSGKDSAVGPTERHFHSEPAILPIFVQISSLGVAEDENARFQKAA